MFLSFCARLAFVLVFWAAASACGTVLLPVTTGAASSSTGPTATDANAQVAGNGNAAATPAGAGAAQGASGGTGSTPVKVCKRGLASAAEVQPTLSANDLAVLSPNVTWWYNWGHVAGGNDVVAAMQRLGMEYVPMVFTAPFDANSISASILPTTKHLLTFNEPNFEAQGNLTPQQAASYWPQIEKIANDHNLLIVSPALNFCGGACNETDPFAWFDAFFAACPNCRVDHLAIHAYVCYGSALDSAYLQPFIQKYNKKIWLTEFSCGDGSADGSQPSQQDRYMREAVPLLENNAMVYRYAWFLARSNPAGAIDVLGSNGKLAAEGNTYTALPQSCR